MIDNQKTPGLGAPMADVQNQPDTRCLNIDKVGVKDIRYPITVRAKNQNDQRTVASVNMYVDLPHRYKGTHMSRFIEILSSHRDSISIHSISTILSDMKQRLDAASAHLELTFPYFIEKTAPVSAAVSLMEYTCYMRGMQKNGRPDITVGVTVPITTLCPCSKEISVCGAHNQRGLVTVMVGFRKFFWLEDLIRLVETSCSAEVFSLLKRADEKFVTEAAYNNPMFVEDVVREVAVKVMADDTFTHFSIAAENFESIHNHSAYAYIDYQPD
ncbi:MAG: GTP cyclohydrolase FolE2 [Candidatus Adiutrix sp.]|nr:GTP cyclohydrolase FolE2 [Candidatus Adiutrix sp.]